MNNIKFLEFEHKKIRALAIKRYLENSKYKGVVCFTCGNAAKELKAIGVEVVEVGVNGVLEPKKWFSGKEISYIFNNYFDATCGHLPFELMNEISVKYKEVLGELKDDIIYVPTGSGETLICLKMAYPNKKFIAVYNISKATEYHKEAPLNKMVELLAHKIVIKNT